MHTVGFTGAAKGLTDEQHRALLGIVLSTPGAWQGIHGDALGGDAAFDALCHDLGIATAVYPCTSGDRAHCDAPEVQAPKAAMKRNRDLVAAADVMIACPPTAERIKHGSGTWATIGFAARASVPCCVIFPDGTLDYRD